jgi:hypothetical protein
MKRGIPVERAFLCLLADGSLCVDWGDGRMQDVLTGEFRVVAPGLATHTATEADLRGLVRQGLAAGYDATHAYLLPLPERPLRTLD